MRCWLVIAAVTVGVTLAPAARADAAADLEKAHNAYVARQYDEAEMRLRALLDAKTGTLVDPDKVADARMYLAATLLAEKKNDEANALLEQLLIDRPDYQPDPLRVSLEAIDALTDARTRIRDKLAAIQAEKVRKAQEEKAKIEAERVKQQIRVQQLEQLASTEIIEHPNSRLLAMVPFGAGQFQNGQTALGWTFLLSEGALAIGSGIGAGFWYYYVQQTQAAVRDNTGTAPQYNQLAQTSSYVGDSLFAGFALLAVIGVVHAQLTFVPEKVEMRTRPLPPVSVTPTLGPGGLGLVGRF
ncbi:MAG TPA: hypothetical protein VF765_37770 [Polyangiaceae bacterium]